MSKSLCNPCFIGISNMELSDEDTDAVLSLSTPQYLSSVINFEKEKIRNEINLLIRTSQKFFKITNNGLSVGALLDVLFSAVTTRIETEKIISQLHKMFEKKYNGKITNKVLKVINYILDEDDFIEEYIFRELGIEEMIENEIYRLKNNNTLINFIRGIGYKDETISEIYNLISEINKFLKEIIHEKRAILSDSTITTISQFLNFSEKTLHKNRNEIKDYEIEEILELGVQSIISVFNDIDKGFNFENIEKYYKLLLKLKEYVIRLTKTFQKLIEENGINMYDKFYKMAKEKIRKEFIVKIKLEVIKRVLNGRLSFLTLKNKIDRLDEKTLLNILLEDINSRKNLTEEERRKMIALLVEKFKIKFPTAVNIEIV